MQVPYRADRYSSTCTAIDLVSCSNAPALRLAPLDDDVLHVLGAEPGGALAQQRLVDGSGILRQQGRLQLEDLGRGARADIFTCIGSIALERCVCRL